MASSRTWSGPVRVTQVARNLGTGGAARNKLRLSEGLTARGFRVSLTALNDSAPNGYEVSRDEHSSRQWFPLPGQWWEYRALLKIIKTCHPLVLLSAYEAFLNALAEATAGALPVIGFDDPSGPYTVSNGIYGVLVPPRKAQALALTMDRLMRNRGLRQQPAANAPLVSDRFTPEGILNKWWARIKKVVTERHRVAQQPC